LTRWISGANPLTFPLKEVLVLVSGGRGLTAMPWKEAAFMMNTRRDEIHGWTAAVREEKHLQGSKVLRTENSSG